jgi:hypothetical protein
MLRIARAVPAPRLTLPLVVAWLAVACNLPFERGAGNLTCIGVPDDTCRSYAQTVGLGSDPSVVAVQLECMTASCALDSGEIRVLVRRADGRIEESGFGWQGADPGAPPIANPAPIAEPSL